MRDTNVKDRPKHVKVVPEPVEATEESHELSLIEAAHLSELLSNLFTSEPEAHKIRDAAAKVGHVTKVAAAAVIDVDLRDVGKGFKRLGRGIKNRLPQVEIKRPEPTPEPS